MERSIANTNPIAIRQTSLTFFGSILAANVPIITLMLIMKSEVQVSMSVLVKN